MSGDSFHRFPQFQWAPSAFAIMRQPDFVSVATFIFLALSCLQLTYLEVGGCVADLLFFLPKQALFPLQPMGLALDVTLPILPSFLPSIPRKRTDTVLLHYYLIYRT